MTPTRRRRLALLGASLASVALLVIGLTSVANAATLFSDDFSDGDTSGWSKSGGTWTVVTDGSAALRQSNASSENARVFAGLSRTVSVGTWYTLAIDVHGTTVQGTVDGAVVGPATSSISPSGRIGVQTLCATASFDDVVVSSAGSMPTTPPSTPPTTTTTTTPPITTPPPTGTLIVATHGNDANPGTLAQPLLTIQRAVDLVAPGGTIVVRGGTYAPTKAVQVLKDGTSGSPITLTSYNGEQVIVDGETCPTPRERSTRAFRGPTGCPPRRGRLVALRRPRNHPRPVRNLRRGYQQRRVRPSGHP
jgi:hypothetical protein